MWSVYIEILNIKCYILYGWSGICNPTLGGSRGEGVALCLATSLVALNTIVVYSWTITIEQPDRLIVQVCTSELELHQYKDTKAFT